MLVAPNLRGDDVVELQSALAKLGFDPGRVDGILGADTARAIRDFQSNSGLAVDGVCGPQTITALEVLARQSGDGPGIAAIKELESIRAGARTFSDLRIVVGQYGGMSSVARQLVQALRHRSATVIASDEPDPSAQAAIANRFQATVYLGFTVAPQQGGWIEYFSAPRFESAGGRSLAMLIAERFNAVAGLDDQPEFEVAGMRLPILRATKMPAVVVAVGSVQMIHDHSDEFVTAIVDALGAWVQNPGFSTASLTNVQ